MSYQDFVNSPVRKAIGNFLQINVVNKPWIHIDLWSGIHFFSGALIFFILTLFGTKTPWKFLALFIILVVYEVIELVLTNMTSGIFIREKLINALSDVVIGMLGGVLVWFIFFIAEMAN